jgi:hypothetical protein
MGTSSLRKLKPLEECLKFNDICDINSFMKQYFGREVPVKEVPDAPGVYKCETFWADKRWFEPQRSVKELR